MKTAQGIGIVCLTGERRIRESVRALFRLLHERRFAGTMSAPDRIEIATSGKTVDRSDRCAACGQPMFYLVPAARIVATFCGHVSCSSWLREIPDAR